MTQPTEEQGHTAPDHKRILLVDDETDITVALKVGLEKRGFRVETYNDPVAALSAFKSGKYDVAVIDIRMPNMTGFELSRALAEADKKIKIVFLTAFEVSPGEFATLFPSVRVHDILKKPMSIEGLAKRLDAL